MAVAVGPPMRGSSLLFALIAACGTPASTDAGTDASSTADASTDAGPSLDPTAVQLTAVTTSAEGPWGVWGYMAVTVAPDRAVVLGGTDAGTFSGTVFDRAWIVTVGDGELSATEVAATGPAPRYCGCAGYDPVRDVVVVFGGRDLTGPTLAPETWELDLAASEWTRIDAATQPPGTIGCAMAWAPSVEALYLFGGGGTAGFSADTYRYGTGAWTRLEASGPLARYDAVMLPSSSADALLLFGGSYGAMGAAFYADLWRFDVASESWSEIALPEGPGGRRTAWVVRDPDREGLYVGFGYDGDMQPLGDLWYADLDALAWTELALPDDRPAYRGFAPALPGGEAALGTLAGGYGASAPTRDAWQLVR